MKLIQRLDDLPDAVRGGAVSIGNFDGVHRGHAQLIRRLVERAGKLGAPSVVFTFEPHPITILRPDQSPPPLTSVARKAQLLGGLGVDYVLAYPTDPEFLTLTAEDYFERIVRQLLDARVLVEGPNFYFGQQRQGTIVLLSKLCQAAGMDLEVVDPVRQGEHYISSTRVRRTLLDGEVELAATMLTEPYQIAGRVVHGAERGRTIGFPTANLAEVRTLVPAEGVYAGAVPIGGEQHPAAIHIGPNPTYGEAARKIEVHLLDWDGDLYDQPLAVDFWQRIRDIRRFASPDELVAQLHQDVAAVREVCGRGEHHRR